MTRVPTVGILALQGDFAHHRAAIARFGLQAREVRAVCDLADLDGLVLPGGESTTMLRLLAVTGLEQPLGELLRAGRVPVLATCAGLILCARTVRDPAQRSYGVLDVEVARNAYGRQIRSGTFELAVAPGVPAMHGVFIRAPRITATGPGVDVLARRGDDPVLVREGPILGCGFHPELVDRHPVVEMFAREVFGATGSGSSGDATESIRRTAERSEGQSV